MKSRAKAWSGRSAARAPSPAEVSGASPTEWRSGGVEEWPLEHRRYFQLRGHRTFPTFALSLGSGMTGGGCRMYGRGSFGCRGTRVRPRRLGRPVRPLLHSPTPPLYRCARRRLLCHRAFHAGGCLDLPRRRQQQGDGLGEIAYRVVAFLEQPQRQAGGLGGPLAQAHVRHGALEPATREEVERPGGVGGRRLGEVALERRHLLARAIGGVQLEVEAREASHGSRQASGRDERAIACRRSSAE